MPCAAGGECNKVNTARFMESLSDFLVFGDFLAKSAFVPPSRNSFQYFSEDCLEIWRNQQIDTQLMPRRRPSTVIDLFRIESFPPVAADNEALQFRQWHSAQFLR